MIEIADGNRLNHEYLSFAYDDDQPREAVLKTSRLSPGLYVIDRVTIKVKARDVFDLFGDYYNSIPERSHSKKNARVEMHAEDVGLNDHDKDLIIQYAREHKYTYFFILDLKQIDLVAYHADAWERLAEGGHPVLEEDTLYEFVGQNRKIYLPCDAWASNDALFFVWRWHCIRALTIAGTTPKSAAILLYASEVHGPRLNFVLLKRLVMARSKEQMDVVANTRSEVQKAAITLWCQEIQGQRVCFDMNTFAGVSPETRCLHKLIAWEWSLVTFTPWRDEQWPFVSPTDSEPNLKRIIKHLVCNKLAPGTRHVLPDIQLFRSTSVAKRTIFKPVLLIAADPLWGVAVLTFDRVEDYLDEQRS